MRPVFIYGGCTSRDAVDYFPEYNLELHSYIARQSLISSRNPADPKLFNTKAVTGNFQRRMLRGDIVGNLPEHLENHAPEIDIFVWDLMIERLGVQAVRTGGLVTRNASLKRMAEPFNLTRAFDFGTDAHFELWRTSLGLFATTLSSLGLKERVVVNATPWATHTTSGDLMNTTSGMTPDWFNENIERYLSAIGEEGIKIARVSRREAIADPDHKWGPAHYHYAPDTYKAALSAIVALL